MASLGLRLLLFRSVKQLSVKYFPINFYLLSLQFRCLLNAVFVCCAVT